MKLRGYNLANNSWQDIGVMDRAVLICAMLFSVICIASLVINYYFVGYHLVNLSENYLDLTYVFVFIYWFLLAHICFANKERLRQAILCLNYSLALSPLMAFCLFNYTLLTPFDYWLTQYIYNFDVWIGVSQVDVMAWFKDKEYLMKALVFFYRSLTYQVGFVICCFILYKDYYRLKVFYLSGYIGLLIGTLIYYFFPVLPPAAMMESPLFPSSSYGIIDRYFAIQAYLGYSDDVYGLIAMPSFHVFFTFLSCVVTFSYRYLFITNCIFAFFVVIATFALGLHYILDIVAGLLLVWLVYFYCRKRFKPEDANMGKFLGNVFKS